MKITLTILCLTDVDFTDKDISWDPTTIQSREKYLLSFLQTLSLITVCACYQAL